MGKESTGAEVRRKGLRVVIEGLGERRNYHLWQAEEVTSELVERIRDAYEAGISESEIARITGVTRMTVRSWLGK